MALLIAPEILGSRPALATGDEGHQGPRLALLPPGTVIGSKAPSGWTHLVIKSVPRLVSGELGSLPTAARETATLFRTVLVADVRQAPGPSGRFALVRLGLGLCVPIDCADTVVSSKDRAGADDVLGFLGRKVLAGAEAEIKKGRILVGTSDFILFGSPGVRAISEDHVKVLLLYAFLVNPATGRLRTVVWSVARDPSAKRAPEAPRVLPDGLIDTTDLDVDAEHWLGAIPHDWSFAMRALPGGPPIAWPDDLRAWAADPRRIVADPARFARRLHDLLAEAERRGGRSVPLPERTAATSRPRFVSPRED